FSSRRRHTRSDRDWSSDVCSYDLAKQFRCPYHGWTYGNDGALELHHAFERAIVAVRPAVVRAAELLRAALRFGYDRSCMMPTNEIGRASCRERGEVRGVSVAV